MLQDRLLTVDSCNVTSILPLSVFLLKLQVRTAHQELYELEASSENSQMKHIRPIVIDLKTQVCLHATHVDKQGYILMIDRLEEFELHEVNQKFDEDLSYLKSAYSLF